MPRIKNNWTFLLTQTLALAAGIAIAAGASAAQSNTAQEPKRGATRTLRLIGCVGSDDDASGRPTFSDSKHKMTYRLTGQDLREYAGRRVEVVGAASRRVQVVRGLTPSPNVAAQAGAIDPNRAAIAAAPGGGPGTGTGNFQLPEFRVSSIRPVAGNCPER